MCIIESVYVSKFVSFDIFKNSTVKHILYISLNDKSEINFTGFIPNFCRVLKDEIVRNMINFIHIMYNLLANEKSIYINIYENVMVILIPFWACYIIFFLLL